MKAGTAQFGLLAIWLVALPALAQGTVEACRKVSDPAARLACYDALPITPPVTTPPATTPPAEPAISSRTSKAAPAEAPTPRFGEAAVKSAVTSDFAGWVPNEKIVLENGQVWQVVDGSTYAASRGKRAATVRTGVLGAYFLDIDGVALSPRVRRIK